mgnify:CR=1 FL=1
MDKQISITKNHDLLAGGYGNIIAEQNCIAQLRRSVLANLLWEDIGYQDGISVALNIERLVPLCNPHEVFELAIEAREKQKLRHVPLFLAVTMCKHKYHRSLVGQLLPKIITRADMLSDFLALYWKDGKCPLCNQAKIGLSRSFHNFDEYQFAKYDYDRSIKLRDVMFIARPIPKNQKEQEVFRRIAERTLNTPKTWETQLSTSSDKKQTWTSLIRERRLGALGFLRNISNMVNAGVDSHTIQNGIELIDTSMLLPLDFLKAAKNNHEFIEHIERIMVKTYSNLPILPGNTLLILDTSGSMRSKLSKKSCFTRKDAAISMAIVAINRCQKCYLVCSAGDDYLRLGKHIKINSPSNGFDLYRQIKKDSAAIGCGGIFTRQVLEWCKNEFKNEHINRIIILTDSQDCDYNGSNFPQPFGDRNYICDMSANTHGINYKGVWTAEISGFSEHFINYIAELENLNDSFKDEATS